MRSALPVLPAEPSGRPMSAPLPVPLVMTPLRTSLTLSAMFSARTRLGARLVLSSRTWPWASVTFTTGVAANWFPRAARTLKAAAMSRGDTSAAPRVRLAP